MDLINNHAHFDDESDEWQIKYVALSGNNIAQTKQLSERAQVVGPGATSDALTQRNQSPFDDDLGPFISIKDIAGSQMHSTNSLDSG